LGKEKTAGKKKEHREVRAALDDEGRGQWRANTNFHGPTLPEEGRGYREVTAVQRMLGCEYRGTLRWAGLKEEFTHAESRLRKGTSRPGKAKTELVLGRGNEWKLREEGSGLTLAGTPSPTKSGGRWG